MPSKKDRWSEIIEKLHLDITHPVSYLSAKQIDESIHEEARLMASIDSEKSLPEIFRRENVFIVPVSRGAYALVHGRGFHELEDPGPIRKFKSRLPLELTTLTYGRGESRFLLHAFHSGLISEFSGVSHLYQTVLGKMGSVGFDFHIDGGPELKVRSAGMEIDMGFEGPSDVLLIEAKVGMRATFLTRQLYYPYRTFRQAQAKRVRPFFFVAEPDSRTYSIWEYEWSDPLDYEALELRQAGRFEIVDQSIPEPRLEDIEPDPTLQIVPQANDFGKVVEVPILVQAGIDSPKLWAEHYGFAVRQGGYYPEAAEGLGLIIRRRGKFSLTSEGQRLLSMPAVDREEYLALRLLRNPVMNAVFRLVIRKGHEGVGDSDIMRIIEKLSNLRSGTPARRAQSVRAYFSWLAQATGSVVVSQRRIYSRSAWDAVGNSTRVI